MMPGARGSEISRGGSCGLLAGTILLATSLTLIGTGEAEAQFADRLSWGPIFGWESPISDMGDYLRAGPTFGLQLTYELAPRVSLGLETTFVGHDGQPSPTVDGVGQRNESRIFIGPPTQVVRAGVNVEFALVQPANTGLEVTVGGGVGLARMISEKLYDPRDPAESGEVLDLAGGATTHSPNPVQFDGTDAAFSGLVRFGYALSPVLSLYVEGSGYTTKIDEEKSVVFVFGDERLSAPDSWSSVGFRLGLRKRF